MIKVVAGKAIIRRVTMSDHSSIEWTDATWNPVRGCTKISPGCAHCYAETFAERFRGVPGHPPPLASEILASDGVMSCRSSDAAEQNNHSDISPFKWNQQF